MEENEEGGVEFNCVEWPTIDKWPVIVLGKSTSVHHLSLVI